MSELKVDKKCLNDTWNRISTLKTLEIYQFNKNTYIWKKERNAKKEENIS